jgi:hypothetical protein
MNRRELIIGACAVSSATKAQLFSGPPTIGNSVAVQQFFNRLATLPSSAHQLLYANLIDGLVADGVWSLLDELCVAGADAATQLTNLVNGTYTIFGNGSAFTIDKGFTPNGTTSYVNSGYNLSTGSLFTQNSGCFGAWQLTASGADGGSQICRTSADNSDFIYGQFTGNLMIGNVNNSGANISGANVSQAGCFAANRSSSSAMQIYANGALIASSNSSSSTTPENANLLFGFGVALASNWIYAAWFIGGSLNSIQQTALYTRLQTFLSGIGAI